MSLNSHQLRKTHLRLAKKIANQTKKQEIVLVLDNVLDTYNIGSFFRLADAIGAKKIYLCGPCVTPPNIKIHRASIGTWKFVPWEHFDDTLDCVKKLQSEGYFLTACEQSATSIPFNKANYKSPFALILGSEVNGVGPEILKQVDQTVEIPMFGVNHSLNVLVAASVISYQYLTYPSK